MRTTLTLDDDVATRLVAEARRSGRSFKETVNETLRSGLESSRRRTRGPAFCVHARDLGPLRTQVSLDSIARLLDDVDGPAGP